MQIKGFISEQNHRLVALNDLAYAQGKQVSYVKRLGGNGRWSTHWNVYWGFGVQFTLLEFRRYQYAYNFLKEGV